MSTTPPPQIVLDHPRVDQWLRFNEEGAVRLRSGRVEIGQGIASAMVQIAAEELDVAPERFKLVAGDTRETPNEGVTSGSRSIEVGGQSVRLAASAARHILLGEAGKLLQAQPDTLTVVDGVIHVGERATDLSYWTLARTVDLGQAIVDHARPKAPGERRLMGRSMPRLDLVPKITGAAFIQDLAPEGMVHGRVLHPPSWMARLAEIDLGALEREAGVIAVVRDGSFVGVVAETEEAALSAIARAERLAKWTPGPGGPADPVDAIRAGDGEEEVVQESGDPASAKGRHFETTVSRPFIAHGSIGTCCALAEWRDGRLIVHTHSQGVFPLRDALATVFETEPETIDVVHVPGAGCYGHNGADDVALDAALLARAVPGRPVRVAWSRGDELAAAPFGPAMVTRAQAVVGDDGRIAAMTVDVLSQAHGQRPGRGGSTNLLAAAYLEKPFPSTKPKDPPPAGGGGADRNSVPIYAIPHQRMAKRVIINLPYRTSSMRGLGAYLNVYALETLMDDIAHELGRDPLDFRLAHLEDERGRAVLQKAAEMAGWPGEQSETKALGLAFARYKNRAAYCAVALEVEMEEEVRVTRAWTSVEAGAAVNPDGIANQVEGGLIQSISWTLKEGMQFEGDEPVSRDWESYPILRFSEVPPVEVAVLDRPELPSLGVGEASSGPTGAAISNAVRRALGVRVHDLPLTRDAIIAAMG